MSATPIVTHGVIKPDGTLELEEKLNLPPGRVRVTLTVTPLAPEAKESVWAVLERIWAERQARGMPVRTREEIDAEINALRDELEEHANHIEALQQEAARARENRGC